MRWFSVFVGLGVLGVVGVGCERGAPDSCPETPESAEVAQATGEACGSGELPELQFADVAPDHTFDRPLYVTEAPGEDGTLYVVEQPGRIEMVRDGAVLDEPFLDIRDRVGTSHNERGLLGLAFHPEYTENGRFFVFYTPEEGHKNVVAEYRREAEGDRAASEEVERIFEVSDPEGNHNGGMLTFGPDGMLYAGLGDGGGAGDDHGTHGNAQNVENPFGSILRFDVDADDGAYVPEDNPFRGETRGDEYIWHFGLRNPWRFSFDRETGDLYVGDVGQNKYEEVDVVPGGTGGGVNFGWRAYEGESVFDEFLADCVDSHRLPAISYPLRSDDATLRGGCSVVGGYVYRGEAIPELRGTYLYADHCSEDVVALRWCEGEVQLHRRVPGLSGTSGAPGSFGEGNDGALYLTYLRSGEVKRIERK